MNQGEMSRRNKVAWSHRTLEALRRLCDTPAEMAKEMLKKTLYYK
jgi:hypothetical protein